mgnify:CR=1 FL=1
MCQNKKEISLNHQKSVTIDLGEHGDNFMDFYLEQDSKEKYVLNLLGLNGEPIRNTQVIMTYIVDGVEEERKAIVKTDKNGKIQLGKLKIVKQISAQASIASGNKIERSWELKKEADYYSYPSQLYVKVGQGVSLPIDTTWKRDEVVLLRTYDKLHTEDYSGRIDIKNGRLSLPPFKVEGLYFLKFLPINH